MPTETVYCIKYALTKGIILILGYEIMSGRFMRNEDGFFQSLTKNEWTRDGNKALELASTMRARKISSIEKQRDQLLQTIFELPDKPDAHPDFNVVGTITERLPG